MKTSNYIVSILFFLAGSSLSMKAQVNEPQDSIVNQNVTVEREYKPVIQDAGKINSIPNVLDIKTVKSMPDYSNFNLPLNVDFNIHTLAAAELEREKPKETQGGFARLGFGNYFNTLADFAYPVIKKPDMRLDFSLNHLATFSEKTHSTTKGALSYDKLFKKFDFFAGVGGGHEFIKYYGNNFNRNGATNLDSLANLYPIANYSEINRTGLDKNSRNFTLNDLANDSINNTFWRFNAYGGLRSLPQSDKLRYEARINYNILNTHYGFTEHIIHSQAGFNFPIKTHRLGMDLDLYNLIYNSSSVRALNFMNAYSVFNLNPYYSIERPNWNVRLGVKSSFVFQPGAFKAYPSADVHGEWKLIPKYFDLYGGVAGGYEINTLDKILTENPYMFNETRVNDTYTPFNFFAGIKIKPLYNLLLDGYVDYRFIADQYFFVNKEYELSPLIYGANSNLYTNRFDVLYSNATLMKIGFRANYNLRNTVNVELKGAYNGWNVDQELQAWNKPQWEASLNTAVRINRNLNVSVIGFYESGCFAKMGASAVALNPKIDINLGASYLFNSWFTGFAKINNLINNPYQYYYGYDVQGLNVMVGGAVSF
ncbi:MAG: hypothetical protein PHS84_12495 [Paludibacter sp.]|nr:hypothetical protein [Paludibacter sp.]